MTASQVAQWVRQHPLSPLEVDCVVAVMLKILDGKCKMPAQEKQRMTQLYDTVCHEPHARLSAEIHTLIAVARADLNEAMGQQIYEQRVLAETIISRPVMKAFKARLRMQGLLDF